jgi:subtilase family serine protease
VTRAEEEYTQGKNLVLNQAGIAFITKNVMQKTVTLNEAGNIERNKSKQIQGIPIFMV